MLSEQAWVKVGHKQVMSFQNVQNHLFGSFWLTTANPKLKKMVTFKGGQNDITWPLHSSELVRRPQFIITQK